MYECAVWLYNPTDYPQQPQASATSVSVSLFHE